MLDFSNVPTDLLNAIYNTTMDTENVLYHSCEIYDECFECPFEKLCSLITEYDKKMAEEISKR